MFLKSFATLLPLLNQANLRKPPAKVFCLGSCMSRE